MTTSPKQSFSTFAAQAYSEAYSLHGDLDLNPATFKDALRQVIEKHLEADASEDETINFLRILHPKDLYLAVACAQRTESGWRLPSVLPEVHVHHSQVVRGNQRRCARSRRKHAGRFVHA